MDFTNLARQRHSEKNENSQKEILNEGLSKLNKKIETLNELRELLAYKFKTYDEHIAKFTDGKDDAKPL